MKTIVDLSVDTPAPPATLTPKLALTTPTVRPNEINPRNMPRLADIGEPIKQPQSKVSNSGTIPIRDPSDSEEEEEIVYKPASIS